MPKVKKPPSETKEMHLRSGDRVRQAHKIFKKMRQRRQTILRDSIPVHVIGNLFAAPHDARDEKKTSLRLEFNQLVRYAEDMNRQKYLGFSDWYVGTVEEMGVVTQNKDKPGLAGTFSESDIYWTRTEHKEHQNRASAYQVIKGIESVEYKDRPCLLRLLRGSIKT